MSSIQTLAQALEAAFVADTRPDGERFYKLADGSPDWMSDAISAAHGDMWADDWRYAAIRAVAGEIADCDEDSDLDDEAGERCDSLVDVYTASLLQWLASHLSRVSYVDDAVSELGVDPEGGIVKMIMAGQYEEYREIWGALTRSLSDLADECNCDDSSWHGAEHQSACPLAGLKR